MANFSPEQQQFLSSDIFDAKTDIFLVKAYAGTGKSFTLKNYCMRYPDKHFLYFVYNASMRKSAQKSFRDIKNVTIVTFHSLAFANIGKRYKNRLDKGEEIRLSHLLPLIRLKGIGNEERMSYAKALYDVLRDFVASAYTIDQYISRKTKPYSLKCKPEHYFYVVKLLKPLWEAIIKPENETLPFEHDFYLKLFQLEMPKLPFDCILVDEAQDITPSMISLVLGQKHTNKIFVGDTFQSIYTWRGAVNSLEYIERHFDPSVFYLSQSFRCPPRVAWLGNIVLKMAGAKKDFVGVAKPAPAGRRKTYIARTNSGLFRFCVENIDKKIYFVGGIKSYNFTDLIDILNLMGDRREYIRNDFIKSFPDFKALNRYASDMGDVSIAGSIGTVFKYMKHNIYEIIAEIRENSTTKEDEADIIVTTAHRSKGLEWPLVELLDDFPFGNDKKMDEANVAEELRLLYVAITRAQSSVKVPHNILEYLHLGEHQKAKEVFMGHTASVAVNYSNTGEEEMFAVADGTGSRQDEKGVRFCGCALCGGGDVFEYAATDEKRHRYGCDGCDLMLYRKSAVRFFNNIGRRLDDEQIDIVLKAILANGGYNMHGLRSKKGRTYSARIITHKHETYGWQLTFSGEKIEPISIGTGKKRKGHRRKASPRPY